MLYCGGVGDWGTGWVDGWVVDGAFFRVSYKHLRLVVSPPSPALLQSFCRAKACRVCASCRYRLFSFCVQNFTYYCLNTYNSMLSCCCCCCNDRSSISSLRSVPSIRSSFGHPPCRTRPLICTHPSLHPSNHPSLTCSSVPFVHLLISIHPPIPHASSRPHP